MTDGDLSPAEEDCLKGIYELQPVSERVSTNQLAARLGVRPSSAIADGEAPVTEDAALPSFAPGVRVVITRVTTEESELLRYLAGLGVVPAVARRLRRPL